MLNERINNYVMFYISHYLLLCFFSTNTRAGIVPQVQSARGPGGADRGVVVNIARKCRVCFIPHYTTSSRPT